MKLCQIFPSWSDPSDRLSKAKEKTIWDEKDHIILGLKPQSIFRPEKMLEIGRIFGRLKYARRAPGIVVGFMVGC